MKNNVNTRQGFTLIEVLVVIVIISILASVASLTIHNNRNKEIETIAHQLTHLIRFTEEEAMLRPRTFGMVVFPHEIKFFSYDKNTHQWQAVNEKQFQFHHLPDFAYLTLHIDNKEITDTQKPYLIITENGETPSFTLSLSYAESTPLYQVIGEENGHVYTSP